MHRPQVAAYTVHYQQLLSLACFCCSLKQVAGNFGRTPNKLVSADCKYTFKLSTFFYSVEVPAEDETVYPNFLIRYGSGQLHTHGLDKTKLYPGFLPPFLFLLLSLLSLFPSLSFRLPFLSFPLQFSFHLSSPYLPLPSFSSIPLPLSFPSFLSHPLPLSFCSSSSFLPWFVSILLLLCFTSSTPFCLFVYSSSFSFLPFLLFSCSPFPPVFFISDPSRFLAFLLILLSPSFPPPFLLCCFLFRYLLTFF
jgi:hypothetical protein